MNMPCSNRITCPPDSPFSNYTSEPIEPITLWTATYYGANGCVRTCTSTISQEDANLCALLESVQCTFRAPPIAVVPQTTVTPIAPTPVGQPFALF